MVTIALQGDYGKPRPALVVQSDMFETLGSVTVLPLTSDVASTSIFRVPVRPDDHNGLERYSQVMADKCTTQPSSKVSESFGRLSDADMTRVEQALALFLGLV